MTKRKTTESWRKPYDWEPQKIHFTSSVDMFTIEYMDIVTRKLYRRRFGQTTRKLTKKQKLRAGKNSGNWITYRPR